MMQGMDPSLLQDFLTESGELLEQLDGDLVRLESAAVSETTELLNSVFRALHTIKGAASFLGLGELTKFAHASEDALNQLRKGELELTTQVMDALLRSVDTLKRQVDDIAAGQPISAGPGDLIDLLHALAAGTLANAAGSGATAPAAASDEASPLDTDACDDTPDEATAAAGERALQLNPDKLDLVPFMADDLREQARQIDECLTGLGNDATRDEAVQHLAAVGADLVKTCEFFDLAGLSSLVAAVHRLTPGLAMLHDEALKQAIARFTAARHLIILQAEALARSCELVWPLDTFLARLEAAATGETLEAQAVVKDAGDTEAVLRIDGVIPSHDVDLEDVSPPTETPTVEACTDTTAAPSATQEATANASTPEAAAATAPPPAVEQTIRVEVSRLESLLNLVGQMVLAKNRLLGLSRKLALEDISQDLGEEVNAATGDLDRLTGELQVGVMRTRMQPLAKLFDRYPRVIRDLARKTGKQIDLDIEGKDTEVDKSVLELLADPLVHILRNSADHGVEMPEVRTAAGKSAHGRIRLVAEHQGSHVRVAIEDDGKGLDRDVLGAKAIEKGMTTAEQLAGMSDTDVFRFIFAAGFSTAAQVSDLSGRGVGMDVVRQNINRMNGTINVTSAKGRGTTIEILIPLTVAIMPAMMVGVGRHLYAIPLQSVVEIVRPEAAVCHSIHGQPVMRLRDAVLPLLDLRSRLQERQPTSGEGDEVRSDSRPPFAVVVSVAGTRAGLLVDRLVGQQEIVIKPLDDRYTQGGPFSGATIRDDGKVSLILDIVQLTRQVQGQGTSPTEKRAAA